MFVLNDFQEYYWILLQKFKNIIDNELTSRLGYMSNGFVLVSARFKSSSLSFRYFIKKIFKNKMTINQSILRKRRMDNEITLFNFHFLYLKLLYLISSLIRKTTFTFQLYSPNPLLIKLSPSPWSPRANSIIISDVQPKQTSIKFNGITLDQYCNTVSIAFLKLF